MHEVTLQCLEVSVKNNAFPPLSFHNMKVFLKYGYNLKNHFIMVFRINWVNFATHKTTQVVQFLISFLLPH